MAKHPTQWHREVEIERIKENTELSYEDAVKFNVKKINGIYADEKKIKALRSDSLSGGSYWSITSRDDLEQLLQQAYTSPAAAAAVAKMLESYDPNFAKIISYFADMFYVRYTVLPVDIKSTTVAKDFDEEEYLVAYKDMLAVADNSHLETSIPAILKELYLSGSVYLYASKYKSANSVSVMMLPQAYCRPVYSTNHGTIVFQFSFKYFDNISDAGDRERAFELFPREFLKLYSEYLNDRVEWRTLEPKYSSAIMLNQNGTTPYLDIMSDIIDFKEFKANDLVRSRNQLKQILTHRIPMFENRMIFDFDEVAEIQSAISNIVNQHVGMETITVFGETELIRLQDDGKVENKQVAQSFSNIYNAAGLNANMVTSNTIQALEFSFNIDKGKVIKHLSSIETFYNIVINNLYNFKPYLAKLKLLHISIKNELEDVANYQKAAEFGIGKLDAIVASGVKQSELIATKRLEDAIGLAELLVPLQSAHTSSGGEKVAAETTPATTKKESTTKKSVEDK